MQKDPKPGVIVLGGHVQALGIIRILGENGIDSIIIDNTSKNIARHSIFCSGFYKVFNDSLLHFLLDLGLRKQYFEWLIIPTNDFHLKLLSTNKSELEKYFRVCVDKWENVKVFYNKRESYLLAEKLLVPIPGTYFPFNEDDLRRISCKFPCIIKPAVMHEFYGHFKQKVFICRNYTELIKYYRKAVSFIPAKDILVQEIVKGSGSNQYSACFLFLNGQTSVYLAANRLRQHPIDFGNATTYAETVDIPILREYGEKLLKGANYNGICEIEFKKDEIDGKYKFLEVNTRTWKWHSIAQKSKSPFLINLYQYYVGGIIDKNMGYVEASFRHALTDIPVQILLFLKGLKYAFRVKKPVVNAVWSWKDILPWIYEKLYLLYFLKNR